MCTPCRRPGPVSDYSIAITLLRQWRSVARALLGTWLALAPWFATGCDDSCEGCDDSCEDGGREYEAGATWTCSDGCNTCGCDEGTISSTAIGCLGPPGPAAGKLNCRDGERSYGHGFTWVCANSCDECSCDDGHLNRVARECSEG